MSGETVVIDLDNTLIDYDEALYTLALNRGYIASTCRAKKKPIQLEIYKRASSEAVGDRRWLSLQHECYAGLASARIDECALKTLEEILALGYRPVIVSHKSAKSYFDGVTDLRRPALDFLGKKNIFSLVSPADICFAETLEEKVKLICKLKPIMVIDDHERVIMHPKLAGQNRIHFAGLSRNDVFQATGWSTLLSFFRILRALDLGPFSISRIESDSTNQLLKLESDRKTVVLKTFPETEGGVRDAANEFNVSRMLNERGICTPKYISFDQNIAVMDYIPRLKFTTSLVAYDTLFDALIRTHDIRTGPRVNDDAESAAKYLKNLRARMDAMSLCEGLEISIKGSLDFLENQRSFQEGISARFVFSDFSPDNFATTEGRSVFLDLEDVGLGDPRRFVCNLFLHPKSEMTHEQLQEALSIVNIEMTDILQVLPFAYLEWVLIIAKRDQIRAQYLADQFRQCGGDSLRLYEAVAKNRELLTPAPAIYTHREREQC
jgi:hypothetical protein